MRLLFAGWGFRAAAQPQSFASCWAQACAQLAADGWTFALLESRRGTPAWNGFEAWRRAAAPEALCHAWPESAIAQIATPSQSSRLVARFATGSVCEALALQAARLHGPAPALVLRRIVSADRQATLAVAAPSLETGVHS
ncbi:MAG: cobalamin biosynthesis protein [Comamonas sp.]